MSYLFILKDRKPVSCNDYNVWKRWMSLRRCTVDYTPLQPFGWVLTKFIGKSKEEGPVNCLPLFETVVAHTKITGCFATCASWEEALVEHERVVEMMRIAISAASMNSIS
jgi:hypothetical protein